MENADTIALLMNAVDGLWSSLVNATQLALPAHTIHRCVLHLLEQEAPSVYTSLTTLCVDGGKGDFAIYEKDSVQMWWGALRKALMHRAKAGTPVHRLEMMGTWRSEEAWIRWMAKAQECRTLGLVQEVVDRGLWYLSPRSDFIHHTCLYQ